MALGEVFALTGFLDANACSALRRELAPVLASDVAHVVFDCAALEAVDQPGWQLLRGVSDFLRSRGGDLVLTHVAPHLLSGLRINDLDHLLQIWPQHHASDSMATADDTRSDDVTSERVSEVISLDDLRHARAVRSRSAASRG